jgi:hypothetical protein
MNVVCQGCVLHILVCPYCVWPEYVLSILCQMYDPFGLFYWSGCSLHFSSYTPELLNLLILFGIGNRCTLRVLREMLVLCLCL